MTDAEPPATTQVPPLAPGVADEQFAVRLREERERKRWSQADVARSMTGWGWHPQTVQKIEAGHRKVTVGEAKALAQLFGTTVDDLTRPGQEAAVAWLLGDCTSRAYAALEKITDRTRALLHARFQLGVTTAESERAGHFGSDEIRKLAEGAREAMGLMPEDAVAAGRAEFYRLHPELTDDGPVCPPLLRAEGEAS